MAISMACGGWRRGSPSWPSSSISGISCAGRRASFPPGRRRGWRSAKALINRPDVLLLDEPTASLDPDTGDSVRSWLERYRAESGCTVLLASHNMGEVERLCDYVLMLKAGRIVDRGSPAELLGRYGRDDLEQVFLDIARNRRAAA